MKDTNKLPNGSTPFTAGSTAAPLIICLSMLHLTIQPAQTPPDEFTAQQECVFGSTNPELPP